MKKLSDKDIKIIQDLYCRGELTQDQLAYRFGVSQATISTAVNKKLKIEVSQNGKQTY